jgi:hypothetical protein
MTEQSLVARLMALADEYGERCWRSSQMSSHRVAVARNNLESALQAALAAQGEPRQPLTELRRMQIIGEEFPLALVQPIVIAKVDSVALAIERAHGIGTAAEGERTP